MADDTDHGSPYLRQIRGAVTVNVLSVCNGLSASWTSPVQPTLEAADNPVQAAPIGKEDFSWLSAALYLGGFAGIHVWRRVADKFGRKFGGYALAATQIVGWLGIVSAGTPLQLIASRFAMGLGGAGIIAASQLYINETAAERDKGWLCSWLVVGTQLGYLYAYALGVALPYAAFNCACLAVPCAFVALFWPLPESPLYLVARGRRDRAREALVWYHHGDAAAADDKLRALTRCAEKAAAADARPASLRELLADGGAARATLAAVVLFAGHQLCGYSFISSYTVALLRASGADVSPYASAIVVCVVQFATACVVGRVAGVGGRGSGRRRWQRLLMVGSYAGAGLSLASLAAFLRYGEDHRPSGAWTWLPTLSLVAFVVCYSSGIGPVSYMLVADMFPARALNNVISAGLTASIALAFVTVKAYPWLERSLHAYGMFAVYAAANALLALFAAACVPDARNAGEAQVGEKEAKKNSC